MATDRLSDSGPARSRREPVRVMVVDDEPAVVEVFQEFLSGQGFALTVVTSGDEAVGRLAECRPDIILTDLNLPGLSGLEVMRAAKAVDPEVCVVVVTGYASASTAIDALRQGATDYVTKPFDLDDVLRIVERGVANRQLKIQNRELVEELRQKNEILRQHEDILSERVQLAESQMKVLYDVGNEISADLGLESRLAMVCARAAGMISAEISMVYLREEQGERFRLSWTYGVPLPEAECEDAGFTAGQGFLGRAVREQFQVCVAAKDAGCRLAAPGVRRPLRNALAIPLVAENQVIGVLCVADKPGGFAVDDQGLLALFASQAGIALRNSQLFEHLKSLDRMKSEFVAVVSHEIRTPLTSVKGALELLADERYFANTEPQSRLLSIARTNSERLLVLINDILDFSKLESSSLAINVEPQRLEPVVAQVLQGLRTQFEERGLRAEAQLASDLPDLEFDAMRIAQVLTNLLSNAIKFSSAGGRITVFAERWEGIVRVGVRDEGEGIDPANLPRLFRKFSQIDSSHTRKAGGTGLGLVICKGIVEQHGGTMTVESTPGRGSTFSFTLKPAGAAEPSHRAPDSSLDPARSAPIR